LPRHDGESDCLHRGASSWYDCQVPGSMKPFAVACGLALWVQALVPVAHGQAQGTAPEYQVKAAYLFNFTKFTEWPVAVLPPGAPILICVAGRDPFGESLGTLETRVVQNHPIHIRRDVRTESLRGCHVVFVTEPDERIEQAVLRSAEATSALTVSDREGFVERGGTIGMLTRDSRILFEINVEAGQRAGLKLSSQMLKLARAVKGRP
jgi:hypothetical protein